MRGWCCRPLTARTRALHRKPLLAIPRIACWRAGRVFACLPKLLRDQALFLSGLLKNRLGGPSVYPYQPEDLYKGIVVAANYPGTKYVHSTGEDLYRRSLYTFWKRTMPHPEMTIFDAPDREFCIVRRAITNTPLQALTLLNDPAFRRSRTETGGESISRGRLIARDKDRFPVPSGNRPRTSIRGAARSERNARQDADGVSGPMKRVHGHFFRQEHLRSMVRFRSVNLPPMPRWRT